MADPGLIWPGALNCLSVSQHAAQSCCVTSTAMPCSSVLYASNRAAPISAAFAAGNLKGLETPAQSASSCSGPNISVKISFRTCLLPERHA